MTLRARIPGQRLCWESTGSAEPSAAARFGYVSPDHARAAAEELLVAAGFWLDEVDPDRQRLVDAAVGALVAGLDGPALCELAGLPGDCPWDTLEGLARQSAQELGLPEPTAEVAVRIELRNRCRPVLDGTAAPRSVTEWAYHFDGAWMPGPRRFSVLDPFIEIEQTYDYLEDLRGYAHEAKVDRAQIDLEIARLDDEVRGEALKVLDRPTDWR